MRSASVSVLIDAMGETLYLAGIVFALKKYNASPSTSPLDAALCSRFSHIFDENTIPIIIKSIRKIRIYHEVVDTCVAAVCGRCA
jgi:hypothetical protein